MDTVTVHRMQLVRVPPGRVKESRTSLTPHQKRSECDIPFYRTKRRDLVVSGTGG